MRLILLSSLLLLLFGCGTRKVSKDVERNKEATSIDINQRLEFGLTQNDTSKEIRIIERFNENGALQERIKERIDKASNRIEKRIETIKYSVKETVTITKRIKDVKVNNNWIYVIIMGVLLVFVLIKKR